MNDKLDDWAKELQETILSEAEEHHGPEVLERWRSPRNWGTIGKPDGFSRITGPCGDTIQIGLKVEGNRITEIKYTTDGCATRIASGSMATELAYSKTNNIGPETILEALGGLPE